MPLVYAALSHNVKLLGPQLPLPPAGLAAFEYAQTGIHRPGRSYRHPDAAGASSGGKPGKPRTHTGRESLALLDWPVANAGQPPACSVATPGGAPSTLTSPPFERRSPSPLPTIDSTCRPPRLAGPLQLSDRITQSPYLPGQLPDKLLQGARGFPALALAVHQG